VLLRTLSQRAVQEEVEGEVLLLVVRVTCQPVERCWGLGRAKCQDMVVDVSSGLWVLVEASVETVRSILSVMSRHFLQMATEAYEGNVQLPVVHVVGRATETFSW